MARIICRPDFLMIIQSLAIQETKKHKFTQIIVSHLHKKHTTPRTDKIASLYLNTIHGYKNWTTEKNTIGISQL